MPDTDDAVASAFDALAAHAPTLRDVRVADLFAEDPQRFSRFSITLGDMVCDWSKHGVTSATMGLLADLARAAGVEDRREAMFGGERINATEGRAVLHTALRAAPGTVVEVDGVDVMRGIVEVRGRCAAFAERVRNGSVRGARGDTFTDVVNIGIGGSDLGPAMVARALSPYADGPRAHFVSNVDAADLADTLAGLDPARTLFLVSSKTFTTIETLTNARSARRWIADALGEAAVADHFAAISTNAEAVSAFGIDRERMFGFWDWVGGRYSVWSAIGLGVMIAIGEADFQAFLDGAREMDEHFRTAPVEANMPVVMAMLGIWHRDVLGRGSQAVLPYDQRLGRFTAWLQQLDMESSGKAVRLDGTPVGRPTGPVVWGEPGTNGQHSFFQLLHQGTDVVPADFLIAAEGHEPDMAEHHAILVANCLAQTEALMRGRTLEEANAQLLAQGMDPERARMLAPHRVFPGNRPSTTIAYRRLDPRTLGRLMALYEHKVFVQGAVWDINPFDQWGVELGKECAARLLPVVEGATPAEGLDPSTAGLVSHLRGLAGAGITDLGEA